MEQQQDLYTTFVDQTKPFDTVSWEGLWKTMSKFGCPETFISIVCQFHEGMIAHVLDDGDASEDFPVTNGVKQGCVLDPTLFSMMFFAILTDGLREAVLCIPVRFPSNGKLFNLRQLKAVLKATETVIRDFLFTDDCALNVYIEQEMQSQVDNF